MRTAPGTWPARYSPSDRTSTISGAWFSMSLFCRSSRTLVVVQPARAPASRRSGIRCFAVARMFVMSVDEGYQPFDAAGVWDIAGEGPDQDLLFAPGLAVEEHEQEQGVSQSEPAVDHEPP